MLPISKQCNSQLNSYIDVQDSCYILIWPHLHSLMDNMLSLIHTSQTHLVQINILHSFVDHFFNILARLSSNSMEFSPNIQELSKLKVIAYSLHSIDTILGRIQVR